MFANATVRASLLLLYSGMRSLSPPRLVYTRRFWLTAKRPLSAKKHERVSGIRRIVAGTCRCGHYERLITIIYFGLLEPLVRIKLQEDVFFVIVTLEGCKPDRGH